MNTIKFYVIKYSFDFDATDETDGTYFQESCMTYETTVLRTKSNWVSYLQFFYNRGCIISNEQFFNMIYDYFIHAVWTICSAYSIGELFARRDVSVHGFLESGIMLK